MDDVYDRLDGTIDGTKERAMYSAARAQGAYWDLKDTSVKDILNRAVVDAQTTYWDLKHRYGSE